MTSSSTSKVCIFTDARKQRLSLPFFRKTIGLYSRVETPSLILEPSRIRMSSLFVQCHSRTLSFVCRIRRTYLHRLENHLEIERRDHRIDRSIIDLYRMRRLQLSIEVDLQQRQTSLVHAYSASLVLHGREPARH